MFVLLEKDGLHSGVFRFLKVAQTNANQPITLLRTEINPRSFKAMSVNSSQEEGGNPGVWLRVRILNSLVFSLRTTVRAVRDSLREADQSFSARRRIIGSVSAKSTSRSKVSSTDMDCVGLSGTTGLWSIPRASSCRR